MDTIVEVNQARNLHMLERVKRRQDTTNRRHSSQKPNNGSIIAEDNR